MALTKIDDRGLKTPIDLLDSEKIRLGTGNDLTLEHNGTQSEIINSTGDLLIQCTGDDLNLKAADDVNIKVQGGAENAIIAYGDGAVELYYDNAKKLETTSDGVTVTGKLFADNGFWCKDNDVYRCGDGTDLMIYHNGSDNFIHNNTAGYHLRITNSDDTDAAVFYDTGAVVLYYEDGTKKFETTPNGVSIHDPNTTSSPGILHIDAGTGASNQEYITMEYGGSNTDNGGIRRDGTSQSLEFFAGSDRRIKKDIVEMPDVLSKLNQIQLKSFKYKKGDAEGIGPIAQDLISIFPNKVKREDSDDGTGDTVPNDVAPWTVGTGFTWELIKAVQELSTEVETLKTKVAALEAK